MGEGVTRVVATDTRVRTLSQEIARMRIRVTAVLTELDRRRHNATDGKHLAREHVGALLAHWCWPPSWRRRWRFSR